MITFSTTTASILDFKIQNYYRRLS